VRHVDVPSEVPEHRDHPLQQPHIRRRVRVAEEPLEVQYQRGCPVVALVQDEREEGAAASYDSQ
jgi:hypothetical protein